MVDYTPRLARQTVFRGLLIGVIALASVVTLIAIFVYYQAVKRFEVRRVALPTRVFTDLFPLRPGVVVAEDTLIEKLERLGYREVETVRQPGDYERDGGELQIHVRGFAHPAGAHKPQTVVVRIKNSTIASVTRDGEAIETAALEPELLTSILSDDLENRTPVTLDQVPKHLIDAVVVTEDVRFFQHPGVDPLGILRAFFRNLRTRSVAEGGSTLTQQLVKNYYLTSERTLRRKIVEAFMALILDLKYSKKEILEAYLNDIYLGRNRSISILGVGQASKFYFGKPVSEMNLAEAAMLAGMIRSPNNYSPFGDSEKAKQRRDRVLKMMLRNRKIRQSQYDLAVQHPFPKKPFRERTGLGSIPYYVGRVLDEMRHDYGIEQVQGRGLSIYTAIDLDWQAEAARSLQNGIGALEKSSRRLRAGPLEGAMIGVDVESGEIRALVGGRDYQRSQFNRATAAKRQVGSLFKPFVYLAAFEPSLSDQNITPATLVNDSPDFVVKRRYGKDWAPRNYDNRYYGVVTVRRALEESMNTASVRLGLATGLDGILTAARALGIESELPEQPAVILGAADIRPIEMAEAYTTIARMGSRVPLRAVRFVTNDRDNVITVGEVEAVQVFPARDTYLLVHLMEGVLNRGTGASARALGFRKTAAGKTGTTNDKRDAWFIGFTNQTLGLTWLGFDDNRPIGLSGSEGAVPIWARYMREITRYHPDRDFPVPSGIVFTEVDTSSGGVATESCPANLIVNEAFKSGTEPYAPCPLHGYLMFAGMPVPPYGMPPPTTEMMPPIQPLPPVTLPPSVPTPAAQQPPPMVRREPVLEGGVFKTETAPAPAPEVKREGEPPPTATVPPPTTTTTTTNPQQSAVSSQQSVVSRSYTNGITQLYHWYNKVIPKV